VPNKLEDTVVTPGDEVVVPEVSTEGTTPEPQGGTTTPSSSAEEIVLGKPKSYWEGLDTENTRLRSGQSTLERKLARYERQSQGPSDDLSQKFGGDEDALAQWASNPLTQDLLLKAAEAELKEGVNALLSSYTDIPEPIKQAILRNPRGFVNPGTVFVDDALLDIEDYLAEQSQGGTPVTTGEPPKEFPVAGTNAGGEAGGDSEVEKIVSLLSQGKEGTNEAFRLLTDKAVTQEVFDAATAEAEKRGILS
jgi:hypothetical protein